jgi:hypothetical protein
MRVVAIQGVNSEDPKQSGGGWRDDLMFTLNTKDQHMVAISPTELPVRDAVEQLSMFSSEAPPVSPSQSRDFAKAWLTRVAISCSPTLPSLDAMLPGGSCGRTSLAFFRLPEDGTLPPSFEGWASAGMGGPTAFSMLSISDWPSDGSACSLSAILETGDVPQRFYLSAKACHGILRRAKKRGKALPPFLKQALEQASQPMTSAPAAG